MAGKERFPGTGNCKVKVKTEKEHFAFHLNEMQVIHKLGDAAKNGASRLA